MRVITIVVQFPALSALVDYLKNQQQAKIDGLAAEVISLTSKLQQSAADLSATEHKE